MKRLAGSAQWLPRRRSTEGIVFNKITRSPRNRVDVEGRKHVLGIWLETAEGAKFCGGEG